MYGFQWRHYGAKYYGCKYNYENEGIDQLQNIIDLLKNRNTVVEADTYDCVERE
jgi:thymidylate synthase